MRLVLVSVLTLTAAILGGCATAYQLTGFRGGFSETQLSQNVYQVQFSGNAFTSGERASDFALLRSAELCLMAGYRYFIVADAKSYQSLSTYTTPTSSETSGSANVHGNSANFTSTTTTTGGETYVFSKPGQSMLVAFYNTPPENLGFVYEARFIDTSLREKYELDPLDASSQE